LSAFELILSREFDSRMKAEPAYWSGLCHLKFGSYIKAEQRFQQAVKDLTVGYLIGPALVGLADSQRMLGKKVEARANYNRALGSFETFIEVSKVRARLALVGGESVVVTRPPKNLSPIDPAPTTSILPKGSFSLQTGAFHDRAVAMQLVNKLKTLGHPPFLHRENREGKLMYKVRVGIYRNKAEAQKVQQQLKARGFDSFIVQ
jgi:cell division protein FtsN